MKMSWAPLRQVGGHSCLDAMLLKAELQGLWCMALFKLLCFQAITIIKLLVIYSFQTSKVKDRGHFSLPAAIRNHFKLRDRMATSSDVLKAFCCLEIDGSLFGGVMLRSLLWGPSTPDRFHIKLPTGLRSVLCNQPMTWSVKAVNAADVPGTSRVSEGEIMFTFSEGFQTTSDSSTTASATTTVRLAFEGVLVLSFSGELLGMTVSGFQGKDHRLCVSPEVVEAGGLFPMYTDIEAMLDELKNVRRLGPISLVIKNCCGSTNGSVTVEDAMSVTIDERFRLSGKCLDYLKTLLREEYAIRWSTAGPYQLVLELHRSASLT